MKTKHWIVLFLTLFLLCSTAILWITHRTQRTQIAEIYQDGTLIQTVDLSQINAPQTIPIYGEHGEENIVLATRGSIRMQSANCPDQLCVRRGSIKNAAVPIVCLPHRIVIRMPGDHDGGADAVTN